MASKTAAEKSWGLSGTTGSSGEDRHFLVNGAADSSSNGYTFTSSSITHVTVNGSQSYKFSDSDFDFEIPPSRKTVTFRENGFDQDPSLEHKCASFNDKVRLLEEQKRVLQDRWSLLQSTSVSTESEHSDLEPIYKSYIDQLLKQVNTIYQDNSEIQSKLIGLVGSVHDIKDKYEDEISALTQTEYDFVQLKKDLDTCSLEKTELEAKKRELLELMELFRAVYRQELEELMTEVKDISVIVEMDSGCPVNLEHIVQEVREQYELLAAKSKEEAEALARHKLDERAAKARKCGSDLLSSRSDIAELNVKIQKMRSEILTLRDESMHLENAVTEALGKGERAVNDASAKLTEVQVALQKAREDMSRRLHAFKELMNVKLSLDMEIATYKKLLEGEESRIQMPPATVVSIQSRPAFPGPASEWGGSATPQSNQQRKKRSQSMLIKPQYKRY
ncbi:keratin, type II cytoskeletal 80-like [Ambystoma mexicanum]|uniref:keratin, type II cytoskeletal 80-like n=1 Tax=Ambystoma mexicanum TaxID=8296 RepID=UPI0037E89CB1